jgi:hypothetical protein
VILACAGAFAAPATVKTALYAQNHALRLQIENLPESAIAYRINNRFTERMIIAMDAPPRMCRQAGHGSERDLHVFALATEPHLFAVGFISEGTASEGTAQRNSDGMTRITCRFPHSFARAGNDPEAVVAADPIAARYRLEYATHPALLLSPRARYPMRDRDLTVVR